MIISHKYKFIFIKTRKTAGTSLEVALSPICGPDDILTPVVPPESGHEARHHEGWFNPLAGVDSPHRLFVNFLDLRRRRRYYNHIAGSLARARTAADVWSSYTKFCVERNPWDKTVSMYQMDRKRSGGDLTVDAFFEANRMPSDLDKYYDFRRDRLLVDRVLRYESLEEDLAKLFGELGVPWSGLNVRAKGHYRNDKRSYRDIFGEWGEARVEQVGRHFRKEVELFSYAF